ncbi:MAG: molybdenum cofactor guanylyltransferase [Candidatus Cloacimonetes bacterium]|nr:molybdenum cofactor guanylyltransferase [Candidatus Cloacimonadota bacterium]
MEINTASGFRGSISFSMKISDITAVILAGGKNTRIQREKSLIKIQGDFLIDKQVKLLKSIFENIIISTSKASIKERFPDIQIVEDEYLNCGPLGGIQAAMKHAHTETIFVFACDMPYLDTGVILHQIAVFRNSEVDILVPKHAEGIEPLHAIYSKANLPFLEESLLAGNFSVRSFYARSNAGYLHFELKFIANFFNINTQRDLQKII